MCISSQSTLPPHPPQSGPACSTTTLASPPRPIFLGPCTKIFFLAGKKSLLRTDGVDLYPPTGVTMGMGGERELRERNDSRKHSRSYPREFWGRTPLVFLKRTRILSGIQFTTHFIKKFVQTKLFVRRSLNVILTRQTCGQRSNRVGKANAER